jgi:5-methylcytosine-specific restriction endonuclease McrA
MMRTYEFDDEILTPRRFRFHVLRCLAVKRYRRELVAKQKGVCPLCPTDSPRLLDSKAQVHHIKSVKEFADDLSIPLTEAYKRCHAPENLQAVCPECHKRTLAEARGI